MLPLQGLAQLLSRVFGARGVAVVPPDVTVIKRTSPSGGGLQPDRGHLLVQRVEGVAPGLYHYHPVDHALEPLRELSADAAAALALRMVAGQEYFADAHVLVAMACALRAAVEIPQPPPGLPRRRAGRGPPVADAIPVRDRAGPGRLRHPAINETDIEQAFGLEPLQQGPLAVCGIGWRAAAMHTVEFDPLRAVWPTA